MSSVSELGDVDPNQWAFQALKSLVEHYGCLEGYPSKKYLGNRPLSRYEFAAICSPILSKQAFKPAANVPAKTEALGINAEWAITSNVSVFGRYGVGTTQFFTPGLADANLTTWQFGFSFPGLFAPDNTLGISAGQPTRATNYARGTETNYELFYNFKLNDRITLTPDIQSAGLVILQATLPLALVVCGQYLTFNPPDTRLLFAFLSLLRHRVRALNRYRLDL